MRSRFRDQADINGFATQLKTCYLEVVRLRGAYFRQQCSRAGLDHISAPTAVFQATFFRALDSWGRDA